MSSTPIILADGSAAVLANGHRREVWVICAKPYGSNQAKVLMAEGFFESDDQVLEHCLKKLPLSLYQENLQFFPAKASWLVQIVAGVPTVFYKSENPVS